MATPFTTGAAHHPNVHQVHLPNVGFLSMEERDCNCAPTRGGCVQVVLILTVKSGPQTWTGLGLHNGIQRRHIQAPRGTLYTRYRLCGGLVGFTDTQPSILPGIFLVMQCAFKILMIPKSCNSYYISHFAAFFIVVGAKKSIAESCITLVMIELGG